MSNTNKVVRYGAGAALKREVIERPSPLGAAEDIASGRSTFLIEMTEVSTIIHQATADSLVVLDEVGRGTATYDGMAIAEAILEHLHTVTQCRGVFATHYHDLVGMRDHLPGMARYQMGVWRDGDRLIFLHSDKTILIRLPLYAFVMRINEGLNGTIIQDLI